MKYSVFTMAAASAAMIVSGPLAAQQASNGQQTREQARQSSQGPDNANQQGVDRSNQNSVLKGGQSGGTDMQDKRRNNQGAGNASDRARERAGQNSAVQNVQPGMMVHDKNHKMLGRVKEVKRAPDGTIIAIIVVLVVQINGTTQITLTPGQFTIVAGVIIALGITAS
jgi:membrane-bound lytic murein transglycosylase B